MLYTTSTDRIGGEGIGENRYKEDNTYIERVYSKSDATQGYDDVLDRPRSN